MTVPHDDFNRADENPLGGGHWTIGTDDLVSTECSRPVVPTHVGKSRVWIRRVYRGPQPLMVTIPEPPSTEKA